MLDELIDYAHNELVAYAGMILILSAFVLETRGGVVRRGCSGGLGNSGSERKIIRDDSLHVSEEGYDG